jgi:hypothetical protein
VNKTFLFTLLFLIFCYATAQLLGKEVVVEDLRFVQETLEQVHPSLIDETSISAFRAYADEIISKVNDDTPDWQVALLMQQLLRYPKDAHTRSDMNTSNRHFLPISFYWAADGLVVFARNDIDIPAASEVVKLGNLTPRDLEQKLSALISGNDYWIRARSSDLLATETMLRYLNVLNKDTTVSLTYRTPTGITQLRKVVLETMTGEMHRRSIKSDLPFWAFDETWAKGSVFAWKIEATKSYALFSLQSCDYNDEYIEGVKAFFATVIKADVKNIIVDLRNNGGGDSRVIFPFVEHLLVEKIQQGGARWRLSETTLERYDTLAQTDKNYTKMLAFIQEAQERGEKQGEMYTSPPESMAISSELGTPKFWGRLYVLTNNGTFSAAIDFATLLSDNKLATLVGEPVGDTPSSPGEILRFETPNLKLPFMVSTKIYVRPDPSRDPADTLEPDIYLPLTVKDIQQKHDPVKTWLEGLE